MHAPLVALIIPTTGRPRDLAECLRSIGACATGRITQLIVVDDKPSAPASVTEGVAGVPIDLVHNPEPLGAAASRNRAVGLVRNDVEIFGFLDDDVRLSPDWLTVGLRELTPERGGVTGPVTRFDSGLIARARELRYQRRYQRLAPGQAVDFLAGGNTLLWRDALARAGSFPNTATMSDVLLARRLSELGSPCHYIPDLIVYHRHSKGLYEACRQAWRAGRIEGPMRPTAYLPRLTAGAAGVGSSPDPAAAALNVALDAIFLLGHGSGRLAHQLRLIAARPRAARAAPEAAHEYE